MGEIVLITGGSGFIGSYLARRLVEAGNRVITYDVRPPGPEAAWLLRPVAEQITHVPGAVDNWARLFQVFREHRPRKVVHLASIVNPVYLAREPLEAVRVNLGGTINVLEAVRFFDVARLVYFSSIGVLPTKQYEPIDAAHPVLLPSEGPGASFYGAAKVAGEAFCFAYHQSFGVDFITLRPSAVYGFGMQYPIYVKPMVENAVRGVPTRFDHGREFPRDYTHAQDVAQLAHRAIDVSTDQVRDRLFYAATGRPPVTAGEIAEIVREQVPGAVIEIAPGLTDDDRVEIRYRGVLDISNAREQLGYDPAYADVRKGIADYITLYRAFLADRETGRG